MPVKDVLYDAIGYSKQIEEARRTYRKDEKGEDESHDEAELLVKDGILKIKLTSEEFLSGWRKGDKLMPIITAVIYLGDSPWDGLKSLFEMLNVPDERLYRFLNDYKLNLISPAEWADAKGLTKKQVKEAVDILNGKNGIIYERR